MQNNFFDDVVKEKFNESALIENNKPMRQF